MHVHRAELLERDGERARFEIECSAGTYVRTLIEELGDAYCDELERTAIGPFLLSDADPGRVIGVAEALAFLPERPLDADEAEAVSHGRRLDAERLSGGPASRLTRGDELVAIAEPRRRRAAARRSVRPA